MIKNSHQVRTFTNPWLLLQCVSPMRFQVRVKLTSRIDQLKKGHSDNQAWLSSLRTELRTEKATREDVEQRYVLATKDWKVGSTYALWLRGDQQNG